MPLVINMANFSSWQSRSTVGCKMYASAWTVYSSKESQYCALVILMQLRHNHVDWKSDANFCEELAVPDLVDKQTHSFEVCSFRFCCSSKPGKKQHRRQGIYFTTALAYALIEAPWPRDNSTIQLWHSVVFMLLFSYRCMQTSWPQSPNFHFTTILGVHFLFVVFIFFPPLFFLLKLGGLASYNVFCSLREA